MEFLAPGIRGIWKGNQYMQELALHCRENENNLLKLFLKSVLQW